MPHGLADAIPTSCLFRWAHDAGRGGKNPAAIVPMNSFSIDRARALATKPASLPSYERSWGQAGPEALT